MAGHANSAPPKISSRADRLRAIGPGSSLMAPPYGARHATSHGWPGRRRAASGFGPPVSRTLHRDGSSPLRALRRCGPPPCPRRRRELLEIVPQATFAMTSVKPRVVGRTDPIRGTPSKGFSARIANSCDQPCRRDSTTGIIVPSYATAKRAASLSGAPRVQRQPAVRRKGDVSGIKPTSPRAPGLRGSVWSARSDG